MTLIPIEADQSTLSKRFRKADYFVFSAQAEARIQSNPHKTSQSTAFFEYFETLGVHSIYLKALGYKTFLRLHRMGIAVYLIPEEVGIYSMIQEENLLLLDEKNAEGLCTLGHQK